MIALSPEEEILEEWRANPGFWADDVLGVQLWAQQVEALCAWRDERSVSWRSCNGVGKTMVDAVGVLWLGSCWENTSILTTATTFTQVKGSVWGEIDHLIKNAKRPLGCEHLTTELRWPHSSRAFAVTAPPTEKHKAKMAGYRAHGRDARTFVLGDEASGLAPSILEGIRGMLTGAHAHRLLTGNPLDPTTEFKRTFDQEGVYKIKTSAFDTPNFTEFGITLDDIVKGTWEAKVAGRAWPNPALVTPMGVLDILEACGGNIEDPIFVARVLGEFPEASEDTVIPMHWIEAAVTLGKVDPTPDEPTRPVHLGVDVARYGSDRSSISRRRGVRARVLKTLGGHDTQAVTGAMKLAMDEEKATEARIDENGVGAAVVDAGKAIQLKAIGINTSWTARDQQHFVNLRSESWWMIRSLFEASYRHLMGHIDPKTKTVCAPGIILETVKGPTEAKELEMLKSELNAPRWKPDGRGRRVVEPKETTKARLGRSPDRADSLILAFVPLTMTTGLKFDTEANYTGPQWQA